MGHKNYVGLLLSDDPCDRKLLYLLQELRKNVSTSGCGRKDVETAVAKWLTVSCDREGARLQHAHRDEQQQCTAAVTDSP